MLLYERNKHDVGGGFLSKLGIRDECALEVSEINILPIRSRISCCRLRERPHSKEQLSATVECWIVFLYSILGSRFCP